MEQDEPFGFVPLPQERSVKPRKSGMTMMMDWGLGLERMSDHLGLVGPYVDLVKIVVGTARLYSRPYLLRKLDLYRKHSIVPFIGGQFIEFVYATQGIEMVDRLFKEAKQLGFEAVEISDNCVALTERERRQLITMAIKVGLEVHGEVGSKVRHQSAQELIAQATVCFDAGCRVVLVEGAELVTPQGEPIRSVISALKQGLDLERVFFELTGPWVQGCALCDVYQLKKLLIMEFGPNINLANVMPDDVLETEALRLGLSVVGPALTERRG